MRGLDTPHSRVGLSWDAPCPLVGRLSRDAPHPLVGGLSRDAPHPLVGRLSRDAPCPLVGGLSRDIPHPLMGRLSRDAPHPLVRGRSTLDSGRWLNRFFPSSPPCLRGRDGLSSVASRRMGVWIRERLNRLPLRRRHALLP
ncbi:hypothetical protein [Kroppenstedtia eburnea]|uniref:hypothetical protein n=1 Tax=Kroppenstedtia eburnea TaxID=714067 RepID=UPI001F1A8EA9|nr:hypothetical protein [Kroppenstedtia eburnea]